MDIRQLAIDAWHITRRNRALWALSAIMFVVLLPSLLLSATFGGAVGVLTLPASGPQPDFVEPLRAVPFGAWLGLGLVTVIVLILTNAGTYILQASVMHGAALAAERDEPVSVREALQLGRERVLRLLRLAFTLGAALTVLALAPLLVRLALGDALGAAGSVLFSTGQTTLSHSPLR